MKRTRNIVLFVLLLGAAFAAYTYFFTGKKEAEPLVKEPPLLSQEQVKGKDLLKVLLSLNNIKLDDEIFSSPLFTSLEDFTLTLPSSGPIGRRNPFAPIGSDEVRSSATLTSASTTPR